MKIINVVGARPNFMKVAPIQRAMHQHPHLDPFLLHTGQHYDARMSKIFFEDLELPPPDEYLGVGSGSHAAQTAAVMTAFETVLTRIEPQAVLVVGDVNSTVACALTAAKCGIPVAHVEAGLRSFDRRMPEEINRMVTDVLADWLFVTEQSGLDNLQREGAQPDKVHLVGNVMIDSLVYFREKAASSAYPANLGLTAGSYGLVTLHRPSNVDDRAQAKDLLTALITLAESLPLVFPLHPRTRQRLADFALLAELEQHPRIHLLEPLGYLDFLNLMQHARLVLTDSGGIQEETTFLGVPCLTLRENTERPITVTLGTNQLIAPRGDSLLQAAQATLARPANKGQIPPLWDGHTAERILEILLKAAS